MMAALLPLAALGDAVGHRRVFIFGTAVFTLSSLVCGVAPSFPVLVTARAIQGLGAAAIMAVTPALIRAIYPPARLGRGLGHYALIVGLSFTAGPTLTSILLSLAEWPVLFLISGPAGALGIIFAHRALPPSRPAGARFRTAPALLCAALFPSALIGIERMVRGEHLIAALLLSVAGGCAVGLARLERGSASPIIALDLFRRPAFSLSSATAVCAFAVQGAAFVILPFHLQSQLGHSQVQTGYLLTAWPASGALMAMLAPRLAERVSSAVLASIGLVVLSAGMASLCVVPSHTDQISLMWRFAICGLGFGLFQSPNMHAIMSAAPLARSGGASGILAASRLTGQSLGAAIVAFLLTAGTVNGEQLALLVGSLLALLGAIISSVRLLLQARQVKPPAGVAS